MVLKTDLPEYQFLPAPGRRAMLNIESSTQKESSMLKKTHMGMMLPSVLNLPLLTIVTVDTILPSIVKHQNRLNPVELWISPFFHVYSADF